MKHRLSVLGIGLAFLTSCGVRQQGSELNVAAAANLQRVMEPLGSAFQRKTGIRVVPSTGSSVELSQQIENGAPFDVFLSADTAQIDRLMEKGLIADGSRSVYARGVLILWAPKRTDIQKVEDLARPDVKRIGIANPELAPYGKAAIETLTALKLWPQLQPKVVYGPNIAVVAQFAESGNADVSFTALAVINERADRPVPVPDDLHAPIEQALGIVKASGRPAAAGQFRDFLLGSEGQAILTQFGYHKPV